MDMQAGEQLVNTAKPVFGAAAARELWFRHARAYLSRLGWCCLHETKAMCCSDDVCAVLATAAGLGLLRPGPGTWGSTGALAFWWFLLSLAWPVQLAIVLVCFLVSWWLCKLMGQLKVKMTANRGRWVAGVWLALVWLPQSVVVFGRVCAIPL